MTEEEKTAFKNKVLDFDFVSVITEASNAGAFHRHYHGFSRERIVELLEKFAWAIRPEFLTDYRRALEGSAIRYGDRPNRFYELLEFLDKEDSK